ncbi:MAG: hypothetical protein EHM13_13025 [Acidobacteria bacterium]|nr:MAG: hypothetical protein EHM13_13025 [Acidobacteriota bacterium]
MHIRARVLGFTSVLLAVLLVAFASESAAQQQQQKEVKLDKAQQQDVQTAVKIVDDVMAGQSGPSDFPLTLHYTFQKARDKRTFTPLTVNFPQASVNSPSVVLYVRVVSRAPAAAAAPAAPAAEGGKRDEQEQKKAARAEYPFEDIQFVDLKPPEGGQYRVIRPISVAAGDYDVFVLVRDRTPKDKPKNAPLPKASLLKQALTVPDYWADELMISSIILSSKAEQLTAPPTEAEMSANPYVFGLTRVTPSVENRFSKKDELSIIFLVYNSAAASGGKPDVKVEYNFHQKTGDQEKFFNRTEPQVFNAGTLPKEFDAAAGHQLVGGLSIPLASFPEGDYRLEIKVIDVAGNKTKVENVNLTIQP